MRFSGRRWEYSTKLGSAWASPLFSVATDLFKLSTQSNVPTVHGMWGNTQMHYIMPSRCICYLGKETVHRPELSHPFTFVLLT